MCGILGYYGNNVKKFTEESRLNLIKHRGPDNQDFIKGSKYFLGHTRLSIQDVSESANQPMFSHINDDIHAVLIPSLTTIRRATPIWVHCHPPGII